MQYKWLQIFCLCAAIEFQFIVGEDTRFPTTTDASLGNPSIYEPDSEHHSKENDENLPHSSATSTSTENTNESTGDETSQGSTDTTSERSLKPRHETTAHSDSRDGQRNSGSQQTRYKTTAHADSKDGQRNSGSQPTSHICTRFTEYYDCQIRDVHLNNGESIFFGLSHHNPQQNLTFLHSTLEYLPKSLIDAFPYMALLNLNDLKIASIEPKAFERAAYLQTVYLEGNRLFKIDRDAFHGAHKLQTLVLSKNNITLIDFQAFGSNNGLLVLYLDQNQLDKLPSFTNTAGLQFLNASHNNLSTIDDWHFDQLHQLHTLDLSFNRLRRLDLQQLRANNLDQVDVSFNELTSFSMPTNVITLNARNNLLREFAVGQQCMLRQVDLSRNNLETQPKFENCRSLEHLDLSHNLLETFVYKKSMENLQTINLAHNNLFEIQLPTLSTKNKQFVPSLKELDLSNNKLTRISSLNAFNNLEWLFLNDNKLIAFKITSNSIKGYRMANNEWSCDEIQNVESKTMDKNAHQCPQKQTKRNGICCRYDSKPYNDRLNEVLREADFHERANQKKCSKPEPDTGNQMTYLDEIRNAMTNASAEKTGKLKEIEKVKVQANTTQIALNKFKTNLSRLTNSKLNVAHEIERQRKSHRVIKEGLISEKEMLERIIKFVQERDAFNKDLLSRRQKDTDESKGLCNEKQLELNKMKETIEASKKTITSLKQEEKKKKKEKDSLEKKVNKNSASIHGSSGTIS